MVFRCDIVILLAFCCAFAWLYPGPRLSLVELLQTGESAAALIAFRVQLLRTFVLACTIDIYLQNPRFLRAHMFRIVFCTLTCAARCLLFQRTALQNGASQRGIGTSAQRYRRPCSPPPCSYSLLGGRNSPQI